MKKFIIITTILSLLFCRKKQIYYFYKYTFQIARLFYLMKQPVFIFVRLETEIRGA